MQTWEIPLITKNTCPDVANLAQLMGLWASVSTLKQFPGCTHWHLKKPGAIGTLEATWWPQENRFWLSVHANRSADWQPAAVLAIKDLVINPQNG